MSAKARVLGPMSETARAGASWPTFDWLATRFSESMSWEYEIVAAGASGDLAYLVAIERISVTANGDPTPRCWQPTTMDTGCGGRLGRG